MTVPFTDYEDCDGLLSIVIEPDFGQERYLTADPIALFASGNFTRVPVIVGLTLTLSDSFYYFILFKIGRTTDEFVNVVPGKN